MVNKTKQTTRILAVVLILGVIVLAGYSLFLEKPTPNPKVSDEMKTFSSLEELQTFVLENTPEDYYSQDGDMIAGEMGTLKATDSVPISSVNTVDSNSEAVDYSKTNIQVEGVDEADIVKNDGKYIYVVSQNRVVIVNAYPAKNMKILGEINLSENIYDIFLKDDKLVVFSSDYTLNRNLISVYNISNREKPELLNKFTVEGNYFQSRMIGDYVYVISTKYVNNNNPVPPVYSVRGVEKSIAPKDIYYYPYPDSNYIFTIVSAININSDSMENKVFLTGRTQNIYVSENNIYLTYTKTKSYADYWERMSKEVLIPLLPNSEAKKVEEVLKINDKYYDRYGKINEIVSKYSLSLKGGSKSEFDKELLNKTEEFQRDYYKDSQKTIIHKISVDKMDINYETAGEVPGKILNQFSMDEYDKHFRIVTTSGNRWQSVSSNNMYVLDSDLNVVGSVKNLAKGERIYSARFMGKRAYMVTFKQTDPLYVLDLSDPKNPEVLGYLKVTGFSTYLHPYDENHIIGIGRDASETGRTQGIKVALFDVSDVEHPVEKSKYVIQGEWSFSQALYEHKAFLFDKKKELLVLPVSYTEKSDEKNELGYPKYKHWNGDYVFNFNSDEISLKGKITHQTNETSYGSDWMESIQRSLYMDDVLYTLSQKTLRANSLDDLSKISEVEIANDKEFYPVYSEGKIEPLKAE